MKILVVNNLYPPNAVGGYERLVALVADGLAGRGHQVSILTSGHGRAKPGREVLSVERSLELLASRDSIYEPFTGTPAERDILNARNLATIARRVEGDTPDAILVGNLQFLDRSVLEAFRPVASRTVYLLTDVWMIQFTDDEFLQDYFSRTVFEPKGTVPPLVPPDPPGLLLDEVPAQEVWTRRAAILEVEIVRRSQVEARLARGRCVFTVPGSCHLCGRTSFVVRRAGPSTLMLGARAWGDVTCARCGLGATVRGALHALDRLAAPRTDDGILLAMPDPGARAFLAKQFPRAVVVASVPEADGTRRFAHAVVVGNSGGRPEDTLESVIRRVAPGGKVIVAAADALWADSPGDRGSSDGPDFQVVARAREAGVPGAAAYVFWSREYGYLGREYVVYAASA